LLAGGATVILATAAQAADLPTKKTPPAPPVANCFATFLTWLDSTPAQCPLSLGPLTLYGAIDVGGGYATNAAKFNPYFPNGVQSIISKQSHGAAWQWVPNGLTQSNVGVKLSQKVFGDVSVVGDVNFGFDPYSLQFANGPESLYDNNRVPQYFQSANGDSSRSGGLDNSRGYAGFSSPTYGTLTYGRQNSLMNTLETLYDPMGGAYAFGLVGYSSTLTSGDGDTETARYNQSVEYIYDYQKIAHIGGIYQIGGYDQGNGAQEAYQINIGGTYAGFSLDGIYAYAKDAVQLSANGGNSGAFGLPKGIATYDLKATLADISAFTVLAKYQWQQWTLFGAYQNSTLSNPSDKFPNGLSSTIGIPNYVVPAGGLTTTAYTINKILQTAWTGVKYSVNPQLDLTGAFYEVWQNNYSGAACVANTVGISGAPAGTSPQGTNTAANNAKKSASGNCAGNEPAVSFLIDYRPFKRVDTYLGVIYSDVSGGLANGYIKTNNTAVTGGVRVSF
jgi:predicted porin